MSSTKKKREGLRGSDLYKLALSGELDVDKALSTFYDHFEAPEEAKAYAEILVRGVASHLADLDEQLGRSSKHWRLERMAKVDLTILRLGAYELLYEHEVPHEVVIDEALELVKQFSTVEAGAFVNGVLAPLVDERKVRQL